jgi:hemerythrin-like domain-containing protein
MSRLSQDMIMIHRVFRRELAVIPDLVEGVAEGDLERAGRLAAHLELVLETLHHHHAGEDALLWPLLRERLPEHHPLFDTMDAQHGEVNARLDTTGALLTAWRATADPAVGADLAAELRDLRVALVEHLDLEEREVLAMIDNHLSPEEWGALGQRSFAELGPVKGMTVLSMMAEESPDEEWATFVANLPPPVQEAYTTTAVPAYPAYLSSIRSG